jgi:uncharacterized protein with PQ loop repeat
MSHQLWINIVGCIFCITGILDAFKYLLQGHKIQTMKSAQTISRQFLNFAIGNDIVKLLYGILIWDFYVTFTSVLALVAMIYMWWEVYVYYPYTTYPKNGQDRPPLMLYIWNSLLSNRIRPHL